MLYTITGSVNNVDEVYSNFQGVAYSFAQQENQIGTPAFFCILYYSKSPEVKQIFEGHKFKTVPYLTTSKNVQKRLEGDFFKPEETWHIKMEDIYEKQRLLEFVNKGFQTDVPLSEPFYIVASKNLFMFIILGTFIAIFVKIRPYLLDQKVWFSIALIGNFICTSGIVFTQLHQMPTFRFGHDQYGNNFVEEYFYRSSRSQYAGEGYLAVTMALIVGILFLALCKID